MERYRSLERVLVDTNRFLVRSEIYPSEAVRYTTSILKIPDDLAITTMCGITASSLNYLFSMKNRGQVPMNDRFDPNFAYVYDMRGIDQDGMETIDGHVMSLFYDPSFKSWVVIDSYVVCRLAQTKLVRLSDVQSMVRTLSQRYDQSILEQLTGCDDPPDDTVRFHVSTMKYSYNPKFWR